MTLLSALAMKKVDPIWCSTRIIKLLDGHQDLKYRFAEMGGKANRHQCPPHAPADTGASVTIRAHSRTAYPDPPTPLAVGACLPPPPLEDGVRQQAPRFISNAMAFTLTSPSSNHRDTSTSRAWVSDGPCPFRPHFSRSLEESVAWNTRGASYGI